MKSNVPVRRFLIRAAGACATGVLVFTPWVGAARDEVVMSVDPGAPLQATLMPSVSISASAGRPDRVTMRIGDESPLAVTLLPAVHVGTRAF